MSVAAWLYPQHTREAKQETTWTDRLVWTSWIRELRVQVRDPVSGNNMKQDQEKHLRSIFSFHLHAHTHMNVVPTLIWTWVCTNTKAHFQHRNRSHKVNAFHHLKELIRAITTYYFSFYSHTSLKIKFNFGAQKTDKSFICHNDNILKLKCPSNFFKKKFFVKK